jgi:predicted transcriptional regulator
MSDNPLSDALDPDLATLIAALNSEQCRQMLRALDEPMTAREIADVCDLPQSTVYSNVEQMVEEGILRKHESDTAASRYSIGFDEIVIRNSNGGLDLSLTPPSRSASEQLSELWRDARAGARSN